MANGDHDHVVWNFMIFRGIVQKKKDFNQLHGQEYLWKPESVNMWDDTVLMETISVTNCWSLRYGGEDKDASPAYCSDNIGDPHNTIINYIISKYNKLQIPIIAS